MLITNLPFPIHTAQRRKARQNHLPDVPRNLLDMELRHGHRQ